MIEEKKPAEWLCLEKNHHGIWWETFFWLMDVIFPMFDNFWSTYLICNEIEAIVILPMYFSGYCDQLVKKCLNTIFAKSLLRICDWTILDFLEFSTMALKQVSHQVFINWKISQYFQLKTPLIDLINLIYDPVREI